MIKDLGLLDGSFALLDYMAGQAPTLNPAFSVISDVVTFATGQNPFNRFYGQYAISPLAFEARDKRAAIQFAKYVANQMGSGIVYRFKSDRPEEIAQELETLLGFPVHSKVANWMIKAKDWPVASNALGRFLKVSDYGIRERILHAKKEVRRENARMLLDAHDAARAISDGKEPLSDKQFQALLLKPDVVQNQLMLALSRKYGMVYMEEWLSAGSTAEKLAVLSIMVKNNAITPAEIADVSVEAGK